MARSRCNSWLLLALIALRIVWTPDVCAGRLAQLRISPRALCWSSYGASRVKLVGKFAGVTSVSCHGASLHREPRRKVLSREGSSIAVRGCRKADKKAPDQRTMTLFIDGDKYQLKGEVQDIVKAAQTSGHVVKTRWYGRKYVGKAHSWKIAGVERQVDFADVSQAADNAILSDAKACEADSVAIASFDGGLVQDVMAAAKARGLRTYYITLHPCGSYDKYLAGKRKAVGNTDQILYYGASGSQRTSLKRVVLYNNATAIAVCPRNTSMARVESNFPLMDSYHSEVDTFLHNLGYSDGQQSMSFRFADPYG
eukprot:2541201-Amphidinium_carterae.1